MRDRPVGIIGAGRVGAALGLALLRAGYDVVGIAARSDLARRRAERLLPDVPILDSAALATKSGLLLLTVADDAIEPLAAGLAKAGYLGPGQYVMHASGARGLTALDAAAQVGSLPLAIHPAMTFPGGDTDAEQLAGLPYAVTTEPAERGQAERLVRDLGGVPIWIPESDRTLYHAALVLCANNVITLTAAAMQALGAAGVADPAFVLGPLVRTSLENALQAGDQALTGPVRRADTGTIAAHLVALRHRAPELVDGYLRFAMVTADRARKAALNSAEELERVVTLLQDEAAKEHPAPAR